MQFVTKWSHFKPTPEKNSGELIVETAGYVPTDILIRRFIDAGQQLNDVRGEYDYTPQYRGDYSEEVVEPWRKPYHDPADIAQASLRTSTALKRAKEEFILHKKKKESEPAPTPEKTPEKNPPSADVTE